MSSQPADGTAAGPLTGREVVLCVCGGIAAYKVAAVASQLTQLGCGVTVAMTRAARRFVGPTTFGALTGRRVLTSLWSSAADGHFAHLDPTERADLLVVAPATANILGKVAHGIADDLVSTLLLGANSPVLFAPAMNSRMWAHPAVRRNVDFLRGAGFHFVGPADGRMACGTHGPGRMVEPDELVREVCALLTAGA